MVEASETKQIIIVPTLEEISVPGSGRRDYLPQLDVPTTEMPETTKNLLRREPVGLPDISELEVGRHYTALADLNFGVLDGPNTLGSCTVKYNPVINERVVRFPGFALTHPRQIESQVQGNMQIISELRDYLVAITGMNDATLAPLAGSQGELTGMLMIKAFHQRNGEGKQRRKVLIPDSAHGSNPASAAMAGYEIIPVDTKKTGRVDMKQFRSLLTEEVAGAMITYPNTHGLLEEDIMEIANLLHARGALLYGDGANLNAIMGLVRPGDLGFDLMHLNLHKSFSGPHGGGGPGAGPVVVQESLRPFLPFPVVERDGDQYKFARPGNSIGRISDYFGSFDVLVRAYAYIRANGAEGLRRVSEDADLNANYIRVKLKDDFDVAYDMLCAHEVVFSAAKESKLGVSVDDIARSIVDEEFHPPTIAFPLTVQNALMVEPTESAGVLSLNKFIEAMKRIAKKIKEEPDVVRHAPYTTRVSHIDPAPPTRKLMLGANSSASPRG